MNIMYTDDFLKRLDTYPHKTKYVRITAQDHEGHPRQRLEGISTGGNLILNGKSKQQRVCTATLLVSNDSTIIEDKYWALQTQFLLEIGLLNEIDTNYDDIIWFKQGVFFIDSFSYNISGNQISVSISGKDKLSKLDGTIGGTLGVQHRFDAIKTEISSNTWEDKKIPIYNIIYDAMIQIGGETPDNIIIKDLDPREYELWEYRGEEPMYLIINEYEQVIQTIFCGGAQVYVGTSLVALQNIQQYYVLNPILENSNFSATKVRLDLDSEDYYYVIQIVAGQAAGYHQTDLIYPEELTLEATNTIVDLLDKLVTFLGPIPYEYFYNEKGQFIFQRQQYYLKNVLTIDPKALLAEPIAHVPDYSYKFKDLSLISQMGVSPSIQNVKNDYILYGSFETATGQTVTTHIRYALDSKPTHSYHSLTTGIEYKTSDWDWRELIYQMACDFYQRKNAATIGGEDQYYIKLVEKNAWCLDGKTGYEPYYADIYEYWRKLYNPNPSAEEKDKFFAKNVKNAYWNKDLVEDPSSLVYWLDFLDTKGEWENISVKKIGRRTYVDTNNFERIYNPETPELQFILENETPNQNNSYQDITLTKYYEDYFRISTQSNSGLKLLANVLNNYTNQADTLTVTAIPIYYLMPNTRIMIEGYGDYIVNQITHNLTYNGTMQLSLSKINDSFIKEVV